MFRPISISRVVVVFYFTMGPSNHSQHILLLLYTNLGEWRRECTCNASFTPIVYKLMTLQGMMLQKNLDNKNIISDTRLKSTHPPFRKSSISDYLKSRLILKPVSFFCQANIVSACLTKLGICWQAKGLKINKAIGNCHII